MHPQHDCLGKAQRLVSSLESALGTSPAENARFVFEHAPNCSLTELPPRQSTRQSRKSCVTTARSLPVSGVLVSCRSGTGKGGTADNPREHCPSVLFGLLRCHCIFGGLENSQP